MIYGMFLNSGVLGSLGRFRLYRRVGFRISSCLGVGGLWLPRFVASDAIGAMAWGNVAKGSLVVPFWDYLVGFSI